MTKIKKNCSRILSTRSDELDTNQSILISKIAKIKFFQKNKVQFSGTRFPVNFFNISTLEKGGGARPSAPRRGAPSRKNLFFAYKKSVWQKKPKPKKIPKKSPRNCPKKGYFFCNFLDPFFCTKIWRLH